MKKIMITNQKGGVGKTTLSFWILLLLKKINKKVNIKDLDFQKSLIKLVNFYKIPLDPDGDFLIIDTSPTMNTTEIHNLAKHSQKIIMPFTPHPLAFETLNLLNFLKSEKEKIALILNCYDKRRTAHKKFLEFIQERDLHKQYPFFVFRYSSGISEFNPYKLSQEERENFKSLLRFILMY